MQKQSPQTIIPLNLRCSFHASSRINLWGNQQNALSSFINVCVALRHTKFLHVSIYKTIIISEHKFLYAVLFSLCSLMIIHSIDQNTCSIPSVAVEVRYAERWPGGWLLRELGMRLFRTLLLLFHCLSQPTCGFYPPHSWGFEITHSDMTQSVGLLWTNDRLRRRDLDLTNTQHSQQTNIHAPGGFRTRNPSRRAATEPRLRPLGHCGQLL